MANPTFEGFSLQDDTYLTREIQFRNKAPRKLEARVISRRLGTKFINEQIIQKVIDISGIILADTADGLQDAVDDLQKNLTKVEGDLIVEDGRTYKATVKKLEIPERQFTRTVVPFSAQFVCSQPFAEGSQAVAGFLLPSGTNTLTVSTTLSGTVENRPLITLVLPSGTGSSPIVEVEVQNTTTANRLTVSGGFTAEDDVRLDYDNFIVTVEGTSRDYVGQFDSFDPGSISFIVTVSGQNDGIRGSITYNPRYW